MSWTSRAKELSQSKPVLLSFYLTMWYFFNAAFNVTNKLVLNQFAHPWVVSWVQLATGEFLFRLAGKLENTPPLLAR